MNLQDAGKLMYPSSSSICPTMLQGAGDPPVSATTLSGIPCRITRWTIGVQHRVSRDWLAHYYGGGEEEKDTNNNTTMTVDQRGLVTLCCVLQSRFKCARPHSLIRAFGGECCRAGICWFSGSVKCEYCDSSSPRIYLPGTDNNNNNSGRINYG